MPAVRVRDLHKTFADVRALDGLDFDIEPGSVFGFLGPNGAGKTTTIRILVGLARATSGQAWVDGVEVTADGHQVARHIGYLPQDPVFYPWMTAGELLEYVGRVFGLAAGESRARSRELLDLLGLAGVARRRIGGFSGGMRQRLGIAQALVHRPPVLLLDEPVSSLDPAGRRDLLHLIERLRGECTVLMSTHILADVERVCDTVGIINRGKLVAEAPQRELLARYAVPAFEVEVDHGQEDALAAWSDSLQQVPWVTTVAAGDGTVRVVVNDVDTAKRELMASALQAGLVLIRYEVVRPSLEDVFMQLVGEGGE